MADTDHHNSDMSEYLETNTQFMTEHDGAHVALGNTLSVQVLAENVWIDTDNGTYSMDKENFLAFAGAIADLADRLR